MKQAAWVITFAAAFASAAFAQSDDVRVVVSFNGDPDGSVITDNGGRVIRRMARRNAIVAVLPAGSFEKVKRDSNVSKVVEDGVMQAIQDRAKGKPGGGGGQGTSWGYTRIGANSAGTTGSGAVVVVADTGADLDHPDLADNLDLTNARDFIDSTPDPDDKNGHGTHVSGIIAAINNTIGVIGVAPQATIVPVQVLSASGFGSWSALADAVDHAAAIGADVVNMSLGGGAPAAGHELYTSLADAFAAGVVLVAASGNEGAASPSFPASDANVIAVGATTSSDTIASYSNANEEILAPGSSIKSLWKGGGTKTISGTSMASPHAAGVAALIVARNSDADATNDVADANGVNGIADEVRAKLTATAETFLSTHKLVDAEAASKN